MNSSIRAILTAIAIAMAVYFFVTWHPEGLQDGDAAPSFQLTDESGQSIALSSYQGKLVLVHFWATWCSTCMAEFPEFNRMAKLYQGNPNIVVLGISLDDSGSGNGWKPVRALASKTPIHFKVLMDVGGRVADQFGTYALPETYLLSPEGQIIKKWVGAEDWNSTSTQAYLNSEISKIHH